MIKKIVFLFAFVAVMSSCKDEDKAFSGIYPVMAFDEQQHDFGDINEGDVVTHIFSFKNTGATNLIISNAVGSCGCTIPEYPKEPIEPGASGEMKVSFNSTGKSGHQSKTVNITANTKTGKETLTIKASITPSAGKHSGITSF